MGGLKSVYKVAQTPDARAEGAETLEAVYYDGKVAENVVEGPVALRLIEP